MKLFISIKSIDISITVCVEYSLDRYRMFDCGTGEHVGYLPVEIQNIPTNGFYYETDAVKIWN